jgi:collagenase-like PrtC family protease
MKHHKLKCWPDYFDAVVTGEKKVELRKDDRNYQVGDILDLVEYSQETGKYSGRVCQCLVTHIVRGQSSLKWLQPGIVALSIQAVEVTPGVSHE